MGDYDRYRHGDNIEMGMGGERLGPRTTLGGSSSTTTSDFNSKSKNHQAQSEPAEDLETDYQPVNWKRVLFTPKYLVLWIVLIIIGVLTAVISLKHDQVVEALRPFAEKVRDITAGWLIFVAVLVVISFPPLFGHELVALLAGVVYGLWIGFAVVAAGTFIGEIGTWFAFKKVFRRKAEKMERTNLTYGAMAKLCRDGGFWIVFVIRLSIIPSHMSTAVFSTCDVKFWHFAVSTFFTLPKQLILVYLGVLLVGGQSDFWIKFGLFGIAGAITVLSGVWIWYKMRAIKKDLIARQERRKAEKEAAAVAASTTNMFGSQQPYGSQPPPHQQPYYHPGEEDLASSIGLAVSGNGVTGDERTPLGRSHSYNNMAADYDLQQQQQGSNAYGGWDSMHASGGKPSLTTTSPRNEYTPYSAPIQPVEMPDYQAFVPTRRGTNPQVPNEDLTGDLGARPPYAMVQQNSPEQPRRVQPHGFV